MAKYAITVDKKACIGCGLCEELAKGFFELEVTTAKAKVPEVDEKDLAKVREAERNCPARGIHVKESGGKIPVAKASVKK